MPTDAQYRAEEVYNRARYDLIRRNQATLRAINKLATDEALTVLDTGLDLERYQYAGFMRKVLPPILDKWGNVSGKAALDHYESAREEWRKVMEYRTISNTWDVPRAQVINGTVTVLQPGEVREVLVSRDFQGIRDRRPEKAFAAKVTQGRIYQATIPPFNPDEMTDPVIAQAMKAYNKGGVRAGNDAAANALTRQIGAYNRDTALYNAGLDRSVSGVQRVVNPNGCAWCKTLAVGGIGRRGAKVMDYAVHFHDHCRCHIETLFLGDKPLRPDYYDDIEKDLKKAQTGDYDDTGQRALRTNANTNATLRAQTQALRSVERSKGLGVTPTPNTLEIARKGISEASTGATVGEIVGKFYGDTPAIGFDRAGLDLDSLKAIGNTLVGLKDKYKFVELSSINIAPGGRGMGNSYAWATRWNGGIQRPSVTFNATYLKADLSAKLDADFLEEQASNWKMVVPANVSKWEYTTTHEFGHIVDYHREQYTPKGTLLKFRVDNVQKGVLALQDMKPNTEEAFAFLKSQGSRYGKTSSWEYVAESFADYELNGDYAQVMSKAVIESLLETVRAKQNVG